MTAKSVFLYIIIILGLLARSRVIVLAGFSLLLIRELGLSGLLEFLSDRGIELGLIFLLMAILAPLLISSLERGDLEKAFLNWKSLVAVLAGLLATRFNGMGLKLLQESPQLVIGIITGSLIGIVLFGGIPVGPLMAAGIAALLTGLVEHIIMLFK
ncbi:MAG: DUF441 domain-containing protein [Halanaerobiaceae bacterium]|nr:DUF441 domain-containing protein [Halanaerobiaceae bacterium]